MLAGGENAPSWQRERREPGVGDPRVVDARRTFGAGAAELEQQSVVEVARKRAFDAEARAAEVEAIGEIARRVVFAVRRAPTDPRRKSVVSGPSAISPYSAPSSCTLARNAIDERPSAAVIVGRALLRVTFGTSCAATLRSFDFTGRCSQGLELRLLLFEQLCLCGELGSLRVNGAAQRVDLGAQRGLVGVAGRHGGGGQG